MTAPRNIDELRLLRQQGASLQYCFFLDYVPARNGTITNSCLSQWWPCHFEIDGQPFSSTEHFMMYAKAMLFGDRMMAAHILDTNHPFEAKTLGRMIGGFDQSQWTTARFDIVLRGNIAKFSQNPKLSEFLLGTRDAVIAETSPTDIIWGTGCTADDPISSQPENWPGQSLLGFALMEVRHILRNQKVSPAAA